MKLYTCRGGIDLINANWDFVAWERESEYGKFVTENEYEEYEIWVDKSDIIEITENGRHRIKSESNAIVKGRVQ